MDLLKNIDKLVNNKNFLLALLDILFLVLPGLMVIFVFREDLVGSLDWVKLTLLSASVTAPLSFWNAMVLDSWDGPKKKMEFFYLLSIAILISGIILDITLLMGYLFEKQFRWDIQILTSIEVILGLCSVYKELARHYREK